MPLRPIPETPTLCPPGSHWKANMSLELESENRFPEDWLLDPSASSKDGPVAPTGTQAELTNQDLAKVGAQGAGRKESGVY